MTENTTRPRSRYLHVICLVFFAVLFSLNLYAAEKEEKKAAVTLMVYMCGSDLEERNGSATKDMMEMMQSGFDKDQVNVLVMTGGSQSWASGYSASETSIYRIVPGNAIRVQPNEQMNMGEADTLRSLLKFGYNRCPADRYALIVWDHGGGPMNGVCWDTLTDGDHLTLDELDAAFAASPFAKERLDWIGFDACLMASVELAHTLAPYAGYMIASQELEPAHGWDYSFLKDLAADESGAQTGERIVASYGDSAQAGEDVTLSCCDLSSLETLENRMDTFFGLLSQTVTKETFSALSGRRQGTKGFGKAIEDSDACDLVDLCDLVEHYSADFPDEAKQVKEAVAQMVLSNTASQEHCCGLSVYHPYSNKDLFREEWGDQAQTLTLVPEYTNYLRQYSSIWLGQQLADWSGLAVTGDAADEDGAHTYTFQLSQDQLETFADAQLLILKRTGDRAKASEMMYESVYTDDQVTLTEDGRLSCKYGSRLLYVVDENNEPLSGAVSYQVEDGKYVIHVSYHQGSTVTGTLYECSLAENGTDLDVDRVLVYDKMTHQFSNRLELVPEEYSHIFLYHDIRKESYEESGDIKAFHDWEEHSGFYANWSDIIDNRIPWHFRFIDQQYYDEKLFASFQITDTQGNVHSTGMTPVMTQGVMVYPAETVVENETCKVSLETTVYNRERSGSIGLLFEMTNLTEEAFCLGIDFRDIVINSNQHIYMPDYQTLRSVYLEPGETHILEVIAQAPVNAERIRSIECLLRKVSDRYMSETDEPDAIFPIQTQYMNLDISGMAPACSKDVLAQTKSGGLLWQLREAGSDEQGNVKGILYCENVSEEEVAGTYAQPALNGHWISEAVQFRQGSWDVPEIRFRLQPGHCIYIPFEVRNVMRTYPDDIFGIEEPFAVVRDPLGEMGITQIEQLTFFTLMFGKVDLSVEPVHLVLDEPLPYGAGAETSDEKAKESELAAESAAVPIAESITEPVVLLEGTDYKIMCYRIGSFCREDETGLFLDLELCALSDAAAEFEILQAQTDGAEAEAADGRDFGFYDAITVPGGTGLRMYVLLKDQQMLPEGGLRKSVSLTLKKKGAEEPLQFKAELDGIASKLQACDPAGVAPLFDE